MRGHMREHSMTGISRTFPHTITSMTVTQPTRRHRTAGGAGMSALITAEKSLFQQYGNKNSIGVEMCVQAGYNYEKAFENTAALVREIMRETGIPLERVYRHYDICSKYCPSQIMNRGDWDRMKRMIGSGAGSTGTGTAGSGTGKTYAPGIYQVQTAALNIRQAPDADSRIAGTIRDQGSYTVTEIQNTSWGRLLSGAGWVNCHTAYCRYAGPAKKNRKKVGRDSKVIRKDSRRGRNLGRKSDAPSAGTFRHTKKRILKDPVLCYTGR